MAWSCKLPDGSEFVMPYPTWEEALKLKYGEMADSPEFKAEFAEKVAELWDQRKVFTKYGVMSWDEFFSTTDWEEFEGKQSFSNMAELAKVCMYTDIRAALFSVIFRKLGANVKVVGITEEGKITRYDGEKKEVFDSFEDAMGIREKEAGG